MTLGAMVGSREVVLTGCRMRSLVDGVVIMKPIMAGGVVWDICGGRKVSRCVVVPVTITRWSFLEGIAGGQSAAPSGPVSAITIAVFVYHS